MEWVVQSEFRMLKFTGPNSGLTGGFLEHLSIHQRGSAVLLISESAVTSSVQTDSDGSRVSRSMFVSMKDVNSIPEVIFCLGDTSTRFMIMWQF